MLHLNKGVVSEGEEIVARCSAPGETGSIFFFFYDNDNDLVEKPENANETEVKFLFSGVGIHKIHCTYTVLLPLNSQDSEVSNTVTVSVKGTSTFTSGSRSAQSFRSLQSVPLLRSTELPIVPVLEVVPEYKIFEGDPLTIKCTISNLHQHSGSVHLYLSQGTQLLSHGVTRVNHSMTALAQDPGEFECKLETRTISKFARKRISVIGEGSDQKPVSIHKSVPLRHFLR